MTHIVIICLPPNSIFFVILLVLHHGLSRVALVPSSKYYQKAGRESILESPRRHRLGLIGHDWVAWSRCRVSWDNESLAFSVSIVESRFCWKQKSGQRLVGKGNRAWCHIAYIPQCSILFWLCWNLEKLEPNCFSKTVTRKQFKMVLRIRAEDCTIWWCHISEQDFRQAGNQDRKESVPFRTERHHVECIKEALETGYETRLESEEAGLLNSAN